MDIPSLPFFSFFQIVCACAFYTFLVLYLFLPFLGLVCLKLILHMFVEICEKDSLCWYHILSKRLMKAITKFNIFRVLQMTYQQYMWLN